MSYLRLVQEAANPQAVPPRQAPPPGDEEIARSSWILNLTGSRIMRGDTGLRIGIWADLDGPELRECIRTLGMSGCRVLYLESETVALRYKVRQCPDRLKGESFQAFIKRAEQIHRERFPQRWEVSA